MMITIQWLIILPITMRIVARFPAFRVVVERLRTDERAFWRTWDFKMISLHCSCVFTTCPCTCKCMYISYMMWNIITFGPLLLGHWKFEIMALYYVKSILTEISASRQDRRVLQKKAKSSESNFWANGACYRLLDTSRILEI